MDLCVQDLQRHPVGSVPEEPGQGARVGADEHQPGRRGAEGRDPVLPGDVGGQGAELRARTLGVDGEPGVAHPGDEVPVAHRAGDAVALPGVDAELGGCLDQAPGLEALPA